MPASLSSDQTCFFVEMKFVERIAKVDVTKPTRIIPVKLRA
jgi:hypothetical protein